MHFRTKRPKHFLVKSAKKAVKRYILATLKITPIYKRFWEKIDGGLYKKHFQNFWLESVSYMAPVFNNTFQS